VSQNLSYGFAAEMVMGHQESHVSHDISRESGSDFFNNHETIQTLNHENIEIHEIHCFGLSVKD